MLTHRLQNSAHLFTLPLGSDVGPDPFLQELEASLVFGNTQQFHRPFFIRRESNDFSYQITNKLVVVGLLAFVVWRFLLSFNGGGLVTFVKASTNFILWSHLFLDSKINTIFQFSNFYFTHGKGRQLFVLILRLNPTCKLKFEGLISNSSALVTDLNFLIKTINIEKINFVRSKMS